MNEATETLVRDYLEGDLDEAGIRRLEEALEKDPQALQEFVDQLQIHHRLGAREGALSAAVVRELRLQGDSHRFSKAVVGRIKGPARGRWWELAAAALVLGALAFFLVARDGGTPAAGSGNVLFVVGQIPLEPGDAAVRARLEKIAGPVTVRTGLKLVADDCRDRTLIAVSSTSLAREVTGLLRDVPVPLVVWEPYLYYDLDLIYSANHRVHWGTEKGKTHLTITAEGHPIAAGLSGRVQVSSVPAQLSWGTIKPGGIKIAALENSPNHAAVFAYERGAEMPARRAGLFLFDTTATTLTDQGWSLFDAAVRWCLEAR